MTDPREQRDVLDVLTDFTDEELLELSQMNAQALLMAGVLALGDDDAVLDTWIEGVAEVMSRGWDTTRDWAADEIMDALLTNYRTYGGWVIEADLEEKRAAAIVADIPDVTLAESLGATDREADVLFRIGEVIVRRLGRRMLWKRQDDSGDVNIIIT
ncbi:MAG: hypothetical protein M9953_08155 [Thermomicrobiales bacterium]|nr:hypothetical protein [Thermomicrobiales bacterium]MCO5217226.1 hypothetical protein [Thermomicrobiales bacterium]MCO5225293.1 hypothetical protein [Thermomicrobiales bacterium]MCO5227839.1 hypothetical protein [Thermomicrobiales bacterium]